MGEPAVGGAAGPPDPLRLDTVFLARHGETEWNRAGRRQGRLDSPLTEDGRAQVGRLARRVAALPVDAVFSSPLGRAAATAAVYAAVLGLPVSFVDDLQEVDGGRWAGLTDEEVDGAYPGARQDRALDRYHWRYPGGESYADADRRASAALALISDAGPRRPLIVSHAMIGRMLLRNLLRMEVDQALQLDLRHGLIYRVEVPAGRLVEIRTGSAELERWSTET